MNLLNFAILVVLTVLIDRSDADCPNAELIRPCECRYEKRFGYQILCQSAHANEMKRVFKRMSNGKVDNQHHFRRLHISHSKAKELEANMIGNITFDGIAVGFGKLRKIHQLAFNSTADRVKSFSIFNLNNYSTSLEPYNLFDMLHSFTSIQGALIVDINITHLPSEVFKPMPSLERLRIENTGKIEPVTSIANRAFYNLVNLKTLSLEGKGINHLSSDVFKFNSGTSNSGKPLSLNLGRNKLNSTSFLSNWINNINRMVEVNLYWNDITFLDQNVFQPFLDNENNQITDLGMNLLNCSDCRNNWLRKGQDKYKKRISRAYCNRKLDGATIFDSKFDHCL